jgi:hypothetical protein
VYDRVFVAAGGTKRLKRLGGKTERLGWVSQR